MRLFLFLSILLAACTQQPATTSLPQRIEKPEYAKGFEIHHYADHSTLLLFDLEKNGDTLALISFSPEKNLNLACQSTTHVTLIDALGKSNQISACAFADRLADSTLQNRLLNGTLLNLTPSGEIDKELLWTSGANYFFIYPFDKLAEDVAPKEKMQVIPISEYLESHPLARAEWIKVFGALLGEEEKASAIFNEIRNRYIAEKEQFKNNSRPTVFFGSKEGDTWFAGPGQSYIAQLIADAGGEYLFEKSHQNANIKLTQEEMIDKTWDIDFFGAMVYLPTDPTRSVISEMAPGLEKSPTFTQGKAFYCNAALNDFFGKALIEPDVLLNELGSILHEKSPQKGALYFKLIP